MRPCAIMLRPSGSARYATERDQRARLETRPFKSRATPIAPTGAATDQREARQYAHAPEHERPGEAEHPVAGHARLPVPTPLGDQDAKKWRHVVHHESSGARRPISGQVHRDQVARADEPEHGDHQHDGGLGAERREDSRGPAAQFHHRALGDLVELLVLGERRGETDAASASSSLGLLGSGSARAGCPGRGRVPRARNVTKNRFSRLAPPTWSRRSSSSERTCVWRGAGGGARGSACGGGSSHRHEPTIAPARSVSRPTQRERELHRRPSRRAASSVVTRVAAAPAVATTSS